jgi:hypothetical protein
MKSWYKTATGSGNNPALPPSVRSSPGVRDPVRDERQYPSQAASPVAQAAQVMHVYAFVGVGEEDSTDKESISLQQHNKSICCTSRCSDRDWRKAFRL